jgi:hypothetical protein
MKADTKDKRHRTSGTCHVALPYGQYRRSRPWGFKSPQTVEPQPRLTICRP